MYRFCLFFTKIVLRVSSVVHGPEMQGGQSRQYLQTGGVGDLGIEVEESTGVFCPTSGTKVNNGGRKNTRRKRDFTGREGETPRLPDHLGQQLRR